MPLKRCSNDGKSGYKWGDKGNCYTGKDAKKKAIRQGVAIEGPEKFSQKASLDKEGSKIVVDYMFLEGYSVSDIAATVTILNSSADDKAGYPPDCKEGYEAKDGKCVPKTDDVARKDKKNNRKQTD